MKEEETRKGDGSELTQARADALLAMEKRAADPERVYEYPVNGGRLDPIALEGVGDADFLLDVRRGGLVLVQVRKRTYQLRGHRSVVLARLDIGKPHTNPDKVKIPGPHLHLYREGDGDKWAKPLEECPEFDLQEEHPLALLRPFMAYCAIVKPPRIVLPERTLFDG